MGRLSWLGTVLGLSALIVIGSAGLLATRSTHAAAPGTQNLTIYVLRGKPYGLVGPDQKHHDTVAPSTFAVREGTPVRLTFINYDEGPHTMTVPGLGLNITIQPGKELANKTVAPVVTVYTFTPKKVGDFRWTCEITCDKGGGYWDMSKGYDGMDQDGFMAGYVIVLPPGQSPI